MGHVVIKQEWETFACLETACLSGEWRLAGGKDEAGWAQCVLLQDPFPGSQMSGIGGLPDLEIMCGIEMSTMSFEVRRIRHQKESLVLLEV